MSDTTTTSDLDSAAQSDRGWVELVAACLLGIAGILTAFTAYQSAIQGGDELKGFTDSQQSTADANFFYSKGNQAQANDASTFLQYQIKVQEGADETASVIRENLFSEELLLATDAFDALPAGDGTASPIDLEEYVVQDFADAEELQTQAEGQFAGALTAGEKGDKFDLSSVFFAVSLFFAGIAALFRQHRVQVVMLFGSVALIVPGVLAMTQGLSG